MTNDVREFGIFEFLDLEKVLLNIVEEAILSLLIKDLKRNFSKRYKSVNFTI